MSNLIPAWVDGTLTAVDKREVHARGLRHRAVAVFVMAGTRVLIQRRAAAKPTGAGLWANTCCTHPHWAEDTAACAVRRLREEMGIAGLAPALAGQIEYRADVGAGMIEHEVVDIFIADAGDGLRLDPDPAEVSETRWVDLYTLVAEARRWPARFSPWLRLYLSDHMDRIFGARLGGALVAGRA
jgi:isopentenyl-diphosphate delta-isomerase